MIQSSGTWEIYGKLGRLPVYPKRKCTRRLITIYRLEAQCNYPLLQWSGDDFLCYAILCNAQWSMYRLVNVQGGLMVDFKCSASVWWTMGGYVIRASPNSKLPHMALDRVNQPGTPGSPRHQPL